MQMATGPYYVDMGGQWVSPHVQPHVTHLLKELGVTIYPQYNQGQHIIQSSEPKRYAYTGTVPLSVGLATALNLGFLLSWMERLVMTVSPSHPASHPHAADLDHQSLWDALSNKTSNRFVREIMTAICRCCFGADPHEVSFLYVLHYSRAAGCFENLLNVDGGGQEYRMTGGAQSLYNALAATLPEDCIALQEPVWKVERVNDTYRVVHGQDQMTVAKRIIMAVPPSQLRHIVLEPALPLWRRRAYEHLTMAHLTKILVSYTTAFWRADGLSGQLCSCAGPICIAMDATSEDGQNPALVMFIGGDDAYHWSQTSPAKRRTAVIDQLQAVFGPKAGDYIDYKEKDWSQEPFTGGCPVNIMHPGDMNLHSWEQLRAPEYESSFFFAGTEVATTWPGFMNGAVESGWRAARECLKTLNKPTGHIPVIGSLASDPKTLLPTLSYPAVVALTGAALSVAAWYFWAQK
ncbi:uncharacterized protein MONBRDRAFT_23499 [Monosiga brevicollis MX1]|uniref:Amine oxidase n=1 Tax=Monosiga brevicollis TaxID=81824 RepID=A9UTL1_MONBE|nr:uncharacterized protein MONBRDRAFT_23499 [Monosiga brevicollis MX1]EDQ91514.1 predicted protein [Monosiga brevicollis MX1]|eukprot:XP_001743936.1 hypothetical protein [Monosiga brevicollis MX1]